MYQAVIERSADETSSFSRLAFILNPSETIGKLIDALQPHSWHGDVSIYDLNNGQRVAMLKEDHKYFMFY